MNTLNRPQGQGPGKALTLRHFFGEHTLTRSRMEAQAKADPVTPTSPGRLSTPEASRRMSVMLSVPVPITSGVV